MSRRQILHPLRFGPLPAEYERLARATDAELAAVRNAYPELAARRFRGTDFLELVARSDRNRRRITIHAVPTALLKQIAAALPPKEGTTHP